MEDDILALGWWVVRVDDGRVVRTAGTGIGLFAVYAVYEGIQVYGLLATTGRDVNKRRGVMRSGEQTGGMLDNKTPTREPTTLQVGTGSTEKQLTALQWNE